MQEVQAYHSEPWPAGILPSVSPGHLEHLSPPKQEKDSKVLNKLVRFYAFSSLLNRIILVIYFLV